MFPSLSLHCDTELMPMYGPIFQFFSEGITYSYSHVNMCVSVSLCPYSETVTHIIAENNSGDEVRTWLNSQDRVGHQASLHLLDISWFTESMHSGHPVQILDRHRLQVCQVTEHFTVLWLFSETHSHIISNTRLFDNCLKHYTFICLFLIIVPLKLYCV